MASFDPGADITQYSLTQGKNLNHLWRVYSLFSETWTCKFGSNSQKEAFQLWNNGANEFLVNNAENANAIQLSVTFFSIV